ncbi:hypothetical protein GLOTRDRAFT_67546 [Gloeophyllum trabeum ATCC 11539]|uniref:Aminoglycoside phosphotransferase domain-containing protein n=1 Tax=Gloeophyllum trabeum (strain ATCC 11539 / FP-39264 / Madison 617) TaxID=670483 RepID=S7QLD2_GLOTA|nr:uncharacterized protein GLOTRDRAFT_67546 [Gloeophyllum trabeum ATCC 11539]EPQ60153.1 hypothetical protein GLOTRDRAFT_67546 [Gloeophyllum trabeum ATCC 11539]
MDTVSVPDSDGYSGARRVIKIAWDTVTKSALNSTAQQELLSTELVRTVTNIPVPRCGRLVECLTYTGVYLLQQFIPGRTLHDAWPTLSWWYRFRVSLTLRYYIYQLRQMSCRIGSPPFPGPPSDDGQPKYCKGRLLNSFGCGPFRSYRELSRWYQNRLLVMQRFRKQGLGVAPFDSTAPLVFTHMDLHLRNLILGDDGQLWVIDWEEAGWYPSWFEAASMSIYAKMHPGSHTSWAKWIPFVAGSCDKPGQLPFILAISYSLECMPPNIMNLVRPKLLRYAVSHSGMQIDSE